MKKPIVHGRVQGYWRGCRCVRCRAANSTYTKERNAAVKSGDDRNQLVDCRSLRAHLDRLGATTYALHKITGISQREIRDIRSGVRVKATRRLAAKLWAIQKLDLIAAKAWRASLRRESNERLLADGGKTSCRPSAS